jgi:hypothetical protein
VGRGTVTFRHPGHVLTPGSGAACSGAVPAQLGPTIISA